MVGSMGFKGHASLPRGEREEGLGGGTPSHQSLSLHRVARSNVQVPHVLPTENPECPEEWGPIVRAPVSAPMSFADWPSLNPLALWKC